MLARLKQNIKDKNTEKTFQYYVSQEIEALRKKQVFDHIKNYKLKKMYDRGVSEVKVLAMRKRRAQQIIYKWRIQAMESVQLDYGKQL